MSNDYERTTRIERRSSNGRRGKSNKMSKNKKITIGVAIAIVVILIFGIIFGVYVAKSGGNVKEAVLNIATDIVGDQDPIFVLLLGVSEDISAKLTDTIMLCGYNPSTQKAFMVSIPRDTFVGSNPTSANGYDKINAQFQKSAEKTVEAVELLTGVQIDYYVIVRNISIANIYNYIGSIDFDVPIDMDYDDPTQNLHIHLKKGYQSLQPDQIEQLLRFRHNNNGTSYPSSYGDNDYGRMKTQREFLKATIDQMLASNNSTSKMKELASMIYTNLQTNMSGYTVLDYVPHGLKFNTADLRSEQLPGKSAMINQLWFYTATKSKIKTLMDELMIYLELDNKTLDSHYKYASEIKGIKPGDNWVSSTVIKDDVYPNAKVVDETVDPATCNHDFGVLSNSATCINSGTIIYKCGICGTEKAEESKPLGHDLDSNGECRRCDYVKPAVEEKDKTDKDKDKDTDVKQDDKPADTPKPDPTPDTPDTPDDKQTPDITPDVPDTDKGKGEDKDPDSNTKTDNTPVEGPEIVE